MDDAPATGRLRVAAYTLCQDDLGQVLLCHIDPSVGVGDLWTLPGGGLEFGEPPAAAALRELAEETGMVGQIIELVDVSDRCFRPADGGEQLHAIRIVYRARIVGGTLHDELGGSTDMARWWTPEEALRLRLGELARHMISLGKGA